MFGKFLLGHAAAFKKAIATHLNKWPTDQEILLSSYKLNPTSMASVT